MFEMKNGIARTLKRAQDGFKAMQLQTRIYAEETKYEKGLDPGKYIISKLISNILHPVLISTVQLVFGLLQVRIIFLLYPMTILMAYVSNIYTLVLCSLHNALTNVSSDIISQSPKQRLLHYLTLRVSAGRQDGTKTREENLQRHLASGFGVRPKFRGRYR